VDYNGWIWWAAARELRPRRERDGLSDFSGSDNLGARTQAALVVTEPEISERLTTQLLHSRVVELVNTAMKKGTGNLLGISKFAFRVVAKICTHRRWIFIGGPSFCSAQN
jgi:hypothetical protein